MSTQPGKDWPALSVCVCLCTPAPHLWARYTHNTSHLLFFLSPLESPSPSGDLLGFGLPGSPGREAASAHWFSFLEGAV